MMVLDEGNTIEDVVDVVAQHGPFVFTRTGVVALSEPSFEEWGGATAWTQDVEAASGFWVGDLIEFGEKKWGETYTQVLAATGYAEQTVKNAAYVARAIPKERRRDPATVSFSHHVEVAALPPDEQDQWLDKVAAEGLTRDQLRIQIRAAKQSKTGEIVDFWVVVKCSGADDQTAFSDRMKVEGRVVRLTTTTKGIPAHVKHAADETADEPDLADELEPVCE